MNAEKNYRSMVREYDLSSRRRLLHGIGIKLLGPRSNCIYIPSFVLIYMLDGNI
jgi:hypothetical protein